VKDAVAILLLGAHLLAMNVAAAGPLVCAALVHGDWTGGNRLYDRMARGTLAALVLGAALGGALLLVPSPGLWAALRRFPESSYWFAGIEIGFSAGCMAVMILAARSLQRRPVVAWLVALLSASNLLYHFPPLMTAIGNLAADPRWTDERVITRAALMQLARRPEMLALWIHVVLASISSAAVYSLWPCESNEATEDSASAGGVHRRLAATALVASALQLLVGVWMLLAGSTAMRHAVMGRDVLASGSFLAGLIATIVLLQHLAAIASGDVTPTRRRRAARLLVIVVLMMSATLVTSRRQTRVARSVGDCVQIDGQYAARGIQYVVRVAFCAANPVMSVMSHFE
jgi:hypothetical protein